MSPRKLFDELLGFAVISGPVLQRVDVDAALAEGIDDAGTCSFRSSNVEDTKARHSGLSVTASGPLRANRSRVEGGVRGCSWPIMVDRAPRHKQQMSAVFSRFHGASRPSPCREQVDRERGQPMLSCVISAGDVLET